MNMNTRRINHPCFCLETLLFTARALITGLYRKEYTRNYILYSSILQKSIFFKKNQF